MLERLGEKPTPMSYWKKAEQCNCGYEVSGCTLDQSIKAHAWQKVPHRGVGGALIEESMGTG